MPRISPRLIRQARRIDTLLPSLLPVCRDLPSARNELRWLKEHVQTTLPRDSSSSDEQSVLVKYVARRSRGEPLQYILSSEFFGPLEIKCKPGVLIPRPETAASVSHLANLLSMTLSPSSTMRVLDLCTGTGCMALLFQHQFYSNPMSHVMSLETIGVDISPTALDLARQNLHLQLHSQRHYASSPRTIALSKTSFLKADILRKNAHSPPSPHADPFALAQALAQANQPANFDVLLANPPYISPSSWVRSTALSVQKFEPRLALVPPEPNLSACYPGEDTRGDTFYPRLLALAGDFGVRVVLLEVADMAQAVRVVSLALRQGAWDRIEVWRDEPARGTGEEVEEVEGNKIVVRGTGHGRSVVAWRDSSVPFTSNSQL